MSTMFYRYNPKGEVVVQVNSPTDYHNFDTLITNNISSALIDRWFLTAKEAMENYFKKDVDNNVLIFENSLEAEVTHPKRGRLKK